MTYTPIVIVGAGPAGIAAAVSLRDRGLNSVIVDRADQVATSWRGRYEKLKLNTSKYFSHLPRRRYPPGTPMFPTRSEVADYFERHARQSGIALRVGSKDDLSQSTTWLLASPHRRNKYGANRQ
jgi:cation diffusion facilitator CzcD-associated flavoprotein CzcO